MRVGKFASILAVLCVTVGFLSPQYRTLVSVPNRIKLPPGESVDLPLGLPGLRASGSRGVRARVHGDAMHVAAWHDGRLRVGLLGWPLRDLAVQVAPTRMVGLGGGAIGVVLADRGSTVVAIGHVATPAGLESPAREAGLQIGDRIVRVDGRPLTGDLALISAVQRAGHAGHALRLEIMRGKRQLGMRLRPVFDRQVARFRVGAYIRSRMTGVGTLTFTDPQHGMWTALGHRVVYGRHAGAPGNGQILPAMVVGMERGRSGHPGQKLGVIEFEHGTLGDVTVNREVGIGGTLMRRYVASRILPLATAAQVHSGRATIYTVVAGEKVQRYDVRLERVLRRRSAGSRSIVVRITDPRLIAATGGIVQGMSGSPVVQDGRLAGAITHVFVRDPTRGYAVFADWMYEDLVKSAKSRAEHGRRTSNTVVWAQTIDALAQLGANPGERL